MADIEKVIKGLEVCVDRDPGKYTCDQCPYENDGNDCEIHLTHDAISLLKAKQCIRLFNEREYITRYTGDALQLIPDVMQELVRCKDCKHRPTQTEPPKTYGFSIEFPEGSKCPCQCDDGFYSWYPNDDWFCADGERRNTDG